MIRRTRNRNSSRNRPLHRSVRAATAALLLAVSLAAGSGAAAETADAFIRALGDTAIRELAPNDITPAQREARFRELLRTSFDLPRITRFVLGRYARRASDAEMAEFKTLYEDLAVLTYAQMFASYAGHVFRVTKQLGAPGDKYVMVVSELMQTNGTLAARLDWQLLVDSSKYAVVDIRVEGVSMAIAQRDEFTAFLDKNNGNMAALLKELTGKVKKLRDERAAAR
ncbi:MAG: ABC transporter substrate-binding protein [Alphaproteobacteria bacterium]|nr:ABC transporter substrate-binding protein [Alphaproteobacteria bacterium]